LLAGACGREPVVFAVPAQKALDAGSDPGGLASSISMNDLTADDYIVRDISPERGHHRWAFLHPEMRFRVEDAGYSNFAVEFAVIEATFRSTGPITVSVAVEGRNIGSIRCDHSGDYRLEKPVPSGVVAPGKDLHVTFQAQPRWVSPDDGAELSFYLKSAGFTR
jgi:hypothetical protein